MLKIRMVLIVRIPEVMDGGILEFEFERQTQLSVASTCLVRAQVLQGRHIRSHQVRLKLRVMVGNRNEKV